MILSQSIQKLQPGRENKFKVKNIEEQEHQSHSPTEPRSWAVEHPPQVVGVASLKERNQSQRRRVITCMRELFKH